MDSSFFDDGIAGTCPEPVRYPFHMPGHKRNPAFLWADGRMDVTEIEGFDDLHAPDGWIAEVQRRLARLYGARESFLMVNGSTAGNQAAILGSTQPGDAVLVARNCHKSVWNALCMQDLQVCTIRPGYTPEGLWGTLDAADVSEALKQAGKTAGIRAVVITAPTYEGLMPNVSAIADAVHAQGALLIVDAAHGAHLADFSEGKETEGEVSFPQNPVRSGADIVVMSLHKTLPCYGQTAVLHLCSDRVNRASIAEWLSMLQTSSPSYILMAQAAACVSWMEIEGSREMAAYARRLAAFRERASAWKHLQLLPTDDPGKLVIGTGNTNRIGMELAAVLREEYRLELEMSATRYVLAMTSVCDTQEAFERLADALEAIDASMDTVPSESNELRPRNKPGKGHKGQNAENESRGQTEERSEADVCILTQTPFEAFHSPGEWVPLPEAVGRTARRGAFVYPPGIPNPAPGETISEAHVKALTGAVREGRTIRGVTEGRIECVGQPK